MSGISKLEATGKEIEFSELVKEWEKLTDYEQKRDIYNRINQLESGLEKLLSIEQLSTSILKKLEKTLDDILYSISLQPPYAPPTEIKKENECPSLNQENEK